MAVSFAPKYSVVIPTRERAHTLRSCLQTFADIDYDDYEIIVGDNCSSEETRRVVGDYASRKVKYYRSDRPLSMTNNFELALEHASGEWIIFIGDDDGFLRSAFAWMDQVIAQTNLKLMRWDPAYYAWPNPVLPGASDYLKIPLSKEGRIINSREAIKQMIANPLLYMNLAGCYHGAVHRSLFEQLKRVGGRAFIGAYPDVYNLVAATYLAQQYVSLGFPLTIVGHSSQSNGGQTLTRNDLHPEFRVLNQADAVPTHPWIGSVFVIPITPLLDALLLAKERFFPNDAELKMERTDVIKYLLALFQPEGREQWVSLQQQIRDTVKDSPALQAWVEQLFATTAFEQFHRPGPTVYPLKGTGVCDGHLHLDASRFGVQDICGAARLCDNIVGFFPQRG